MYSDKRNNSLASPLSCYSSQTDLLFLQDFQLYNQEPMECSLLMGMIWWPLCSILTVWFCIHSPVCLNESHGEMSRLWKYTDISVSVCVCSRRAVLRTSCSQAVKFNLHTQENNSTLSHLLFKRTNTTFVAEWKIAHFFVVFLWLL